VYNIIIIRIIQWKKREKKRKKKKFFEKFFKKKFFKILEHFIKYRLFKKTVNFRKILFMCKFNHLILYFFVYLISPKCKGQEVGKAARYARRSPIVRFSFRQQDSRYLTNVVEAEFAEYQKLVAPSCIGVTDMRSSAGRKSCSEL